MSKENITEQIQMLRGKTVKSIDMSFHEEYDCIQIRSITYTDGTVAYMGGEHDCAYIDFIGDPPTNHSGT